MQNIYKNVCILTHLYVNVKKNATSVNKRLLYTSFFKVAEVYGLAVWKNDIWRLS